jgi:hypothetical protein
MKAGNRMINLITLSLGVGSTDLKRVFSDLRNW